MRRITILGVALIWVTRYSDMPTASDAISTKSMPLVERSTLNEAMPAELSAQERSIRDPETTIAVKFTGAEGPPAGVVATATVENAELPTVL